MRWRLSIAAIAVAGCLALSQPAEGAGETMIAKMNWDAGEVKIQGATYHLRYEDAHIVIDTLGLIEEDDPPITTSDGEFDASTHGVTGVDVDGQTYHRLTVDWEADPIHGVTGASHWGVEFQVWTSSYTSGEAAPIIREAKMTGITCEALGITDPETWDLPAPTTNTWDRANSAEWVFSIDNVNLLGPMTFRNVSFYKTDTEPALSDLTAVNFPPLPKTHLLDIPDFVLSPGLVFPVTVPDVDVPEWIMCYYETEYRDPLLSAWVGNDAFLTMRVWVAGQMIGYLGDLDGDYVVGQNDLDTVLGDWGNSPPLNPFADPTGDGHVGQDDLDTVLGDWGQGTAPPVPEPAGLSLLALGGVALLRRRRR